MNPFAPRRIDFAEHNHFILEVINHPMFLNLKLIPSICRVNEVGHQAPDIFQFCRGTGCLAIQRARHSALIYI
jgi:hypothetical protein